MMVPSTFLSNWCRTAYDLLYIIHGKIVSRQFNNILIPVSRTLRKIGVNNFFTNHYNPRENVEIDGGTLSLVVMSVRENVSLEYTCSFYIVAQKVALPSLIHNSELDEGLSLGANRRMIGLPFPIRIFWVHRYTSNLPLASIRVE